MPCSAVEPDRMRAGSEKLPEAGSETLYLFGYIRYVKRQKWLILKYKEIQKKYICNLNVFHQWRRPDVAKTVREVCCGV